MSSLNRPGETGVVENSRFNKHLLIGYFFLSLVFLGAVSSVYYWEKKAKVGASTGYSQGLVGSGEQSSSNNGVACAQVITAARNKQTGEIREFPTPCDVNTEWWEIIKN